MYKLEYPPEEFQIFGTSEASVLHFLHVLKLI